MFRRLISLFRREQFSISSKVDDSPGWTSISSRPHDRNWAEIQELYTDALTAWRKNPMAWRIVSLITDFVVGDKILVNSPVPELNSFIKEFWHHRKNKMSLRLNSLSDELVRAGDIFVALFLNPDDGMSFIRFVTKDQIVRIVTAENDWETELEYHEAFSDVELGGSRVWYSPDSPKAKDSDAIMLHYAINRPIGALMGESDLSPIIPWLLRYSRMIEDRLRLHWAARAFLFLVTVPASKVKAKAEQYNTPPDSGSIIVKDESESWDVLTPDMKGFDASFDTKAIRQLIDAGAGMPPHWRGEGDDVNRTTAWAMQNPAERHLNSRRKQITHMLQDILYHAYQRAVEIDKQPPLTTHIYEDLFQIEVSDLSRRDNFEMAQAGRYMAQAMSALLESYPALSPQLTKLITKLVFQFAGEPQDQETLEKIITEAWASDVAKVAPTLTTDDSSLENEPPEGDQ